MSDDERDPVTMRRFELDRSTGKAKAVAKRGAVEMMIDATVRCVHCGKPPGCACWIRFVCEVCGDARSVLASDIVDAQGAPIELDDLVSVGPAGDRFMLIRCPEHDHEPVSPSTE